MTKIEWCDEVWNPVTGCSHAGSPGCDNCYAKRMANRLRGRCGYPQDNPFAVTVHRNRFDLPRRWKKPRRVFVNSMGDLFHEEVPHETITDIFRVMVSCPQHTFMVLTKRPKRMRSFMFGRIPGIKGHGKPSFDLLVNIWLGVTAENQEQADKRIPILLDVPAKVRFVSVEPMLGPVDIWRWLPQVDGDRVPFEIRKTMIAPPRKIDWVICGAETGPGKRKMQLEWATTLMNQCRNAGVPFFFKKDSFGGQGGMPREFPRL